jgi:hypothetical protein
MANLTDYLKQVNFNLENSVMRPKKIIAEQTDEQLVLWNSEQDRWSRRAKHPLKLNEIDTHAEIESLEEGVLGGMQPLNPINRIMQLAGISTNNIMEPVAETETEESAVIAEADATNMFDGLFKANANGEYRNNPDAARIATIGQIMAGLESQIEPLRGKLAPDMEQKLNVAVGLGAALITAAKNMLKPEA